MILNLNFSIQKRKRLVRAAPYDCGCVGNLFTSVVNITLNEFVRKYNIAGAKQGRFKNDLYTTVKLLITYQDMNCNINGNIFRQNLYATAESSVIMNSKLSASFPCQTRVRQGDNLAPLLFVIYLHHLEHVLQHKYNRPNLLSEIQNRNYILNKIENYIKLFVLMYADDPILGLLADSEEDLQDALSAMFNYCDTWKLQVNVKKTKNVFFSMRKDQENSNLFFCPKLLDVVDNYTYLGVKFNFNGRFVKEKQSSYSMNVEQCSYYVRLPINIQLQLFHMFATPVVMYEPEA